MTKTIRASEAYRDEMALETVLSGRRDLGTISIKVKINGELYKKNQNLLPVIKKAGLKTLRIPSNPCELYIYYKPGAEDKAEELKNIAEKYNGYFAYWATEEDTRRIGQLLQYDPMDIEKFINKNKK